ncbi:MAG: hypothetical protein VB081_04010 [Christensenella sp.]|uniref:hypothetical protein n=1 Tax=Christensenella sp. TaxID=1935934 RepID=UPI002B2196C3|nr:hypothetical protein [Christensenella sp.]MEA5002643.1 hypothetical protein [Christensenella sp.]
MKKKIIALLVAALMIVTMLPAVAMATEGGGGEPSTVSFAAATGDMLGVDASALMTGMGFGVNSENPKQFDVTGTLHYTSDYTGFSSNEAEQSGYYLAFVLSGAKQEDDITFWGTGAHVALDKNDMTGIVFMGNDTSVHKSISVQINQDVYTLDTSAVTLETQVTPEPLIANQKVYFVDESNYAELGEDDGVFDPDHNDLPWLETTFDINKAEVKNPTAFKIEVKIENANISKDTQDKENAVPAGNVYADGSATFTRTVDLVDLTQRTGWAEATDTFAFKRNFAIGGQVFDGHDDFLGIAKEKQESAYKVTVTATDGVDGETLALDAVSATYEAPKPVPVSIAAATGDMLGKDATDLMDGVTFTKVAEADQFNVTGTLNYVSDYTGFSSNEAEQSGYYLAFTLSGAKAEDDITFWGTGSPVALDKNDMTGIVYMGKDKDVHKAVSVKINDKTYTLNTDGLVLAPQPVKNPLIANQKLHFVDESNYAEEFDPDNHDLPWVETSFVIYKSEIKDPTNFKYTVKVENDKIAADTKDKDGNLPAGNTYAAGSATFERTFDLTQSRAWTDETRETIKFTFNAAMGAQVFDGHDDFLGIDKANQQGDYKVTVTAQDGSGESLALDAMSATYGGSELKPKPADPGKEVEISAPDASTGEQYISGGGIGDGTAGGAVKAQDIATLFDNPGGAITVTDSAGNELAATDNVGTGCVIQLKNGEGVFQEVLVVVKGDVTGRGVVDSTDLMDIVGHIRGTSTLSGAFLKAANTTGSANDAITSADLMDVVVLVKGNH